MTPADVDFDLEREPMDRAGLFLFGVAWLISWLAVWVAYRACVALIER